MKEQDILKMDRKGLINELKAARDGRLTLRGKFHVVHRAADGKVISEETVNNIVCDTGINYMLDSALHGSTQISDWYMAPWSTNNAESGTATYASPGNTEATTQYTESNRQAWAEGAASSKSITNATAATITSTTDWTCYGIGIVGGGTGADSKGDTAGGGTLLATALFSAGKTLANLETLDITYTMTGSSS